MKKKKIKILIINLHCKNRGDESAGYALLGNLLKRDKVGKIKIIYNFVGLFKSEFGISDKNNKCENLFFCASELIYHAGKIKKFILFFAPLKLLKIIFRETSIAKEIKEIENADLIISAPGGINLSRYYFDWAYLWRIYTAIRLKKKVAIYSPSIGPFSDKGYFSKCAIKTLKKVDFLSLRDIESQMIATSLEIPYLKSVDTCFLDFPVSSTSVIPSVGLSDYMVFVPNQLYTWHFLYKEISANVLNELYFRIINFFISHNIRVVLLPHLFCSNEEMEYFNFFSKSLNTGMVKVLPQIYDHVAQERIIKNSIFLVGARYHSIVFAIKNQVPFFSLNYEHKMSGMLKMLGINNCDISIYDALVEKNVNGILASMRESFLNRDKNREEINKALDYARELSRQTFDVFVGKFSL